MRKRLYLNLLSGLIAITSMSIAQASITIPMFQVTANGPGQRLGTITADDSFNGVLLTPSLRGLPAGVHGFHIHVNPACGDNGMAAGGHLDPANTNQHNGPFDNAGHLGDMPVLVVNSDGTATLPTFAPRFTIKNMLGHSIVIHAGGDNYSDQPEKLGGGGARIACGVIEAA